MKVAAPNVRRRVKHNTGNLKTTWQPARESVVLNNSADVEPAPALETSPDCLGPLETGGDRFHFNSLIAQICLIQLFRYTEAQYAARNSAGHRLVQTGYAWRTFSRLFVPRNAIDSVRLFENLLRFANDDAHVLARSFFLAYAPLSFEHDACGEFIGPGVWTPDAGSRTAAVRVRRTLKRWCEWLEALAHFRVHQSHIHAAETSRLDKAVIFLWPLLKRHEWGYDELLDVLRTFLGSGNSYPCGSQAQLVSYCRGVLGLRKIKAPVVGGRGVLSGQSVAERLLRFLPVIQ
jgi:hypothetical protein